MSSITSKCHSCIFSVYDDSKKSELERVNYRYKTCLSRCSLISKPLSILSEEDMKECHYIERK